MRRTRRRVQQSMRHVAHTLCDKAGRLYAQMHNVPSVLSARVPSPVVVMGTGAGMHTAFSVRGHAATATPFRTACRLVVDLGLIVSPEDELLSSDV